MPEHHVPRVDLRHGRHGFFEPEVRVRVMTQSRTAVSPTTFVDTRKIGSADICNRPRHASSNVIILEKIRTKRPVLGVIYLQGLLIYEGTEKRS